jgi:D-amino-acid dehydrogenase
MSMRGRRTRRTGRSAAGARELPERVDVAVVGGGIVGVCIADALAARGASVALLERGELCSGASYGNAGWIFPSHCLPIPQPGVIRNALRWLGDPDSPFYIRPRASLALLRWLWTFRGACNAQAMQRTSALRRALALASLDHYAKYAARGDLSFGFERNGLMLVCKSAEGLLHAERELAMLRELGGDGERLTPEQARERSPALATDLRGAVFYPGDAHVDPEAFVRALADDLELRGAAVRTGSEIVDVEWTRASGVVVHTTRGELRCKDLVLAAGAWTPRLAEPLGLRLPVEAAKGYSWTMRRPESFRSPPMLLSESRVAVTPLGGRLRFAGTLELAGLDLSVNLRRVRAIERAIPEYLPQLPPLEPLELWRGLRPLTPDDLPIIGRPAGTRGLVIATGHGMSGVSQAPATGELVAQLIGGEPTSIPLAPFSPDRFE